MGFQECEARGRRLVDGMRQRWLQRRQEALEPALRRQMGLPGQGQTTLAAQAATQQRLQRANAASQTFQAYLTDIEATIQGGPRHATSRVSRQPNAWSLPQSATFENSFYPHRSHPAQQGHDVRIIADRNFDSQGIGLANSEVLFLQYQAVGFQQRAHSLKRQHITNSETREVTAASFQRQGFNPSTSDKMIVYRYELATRTSTRSWAPPTAGPAPTW